MRQNTLWCIILAGVLGMASLALGQDRALQQLIVGKKHFWEARFDEAATALKEVVGVPNVKSEYLFEAYLYLGFVLTRQQAPASDANEAFEQAIKIDPKRKLDELVIPPDLTTRFNEVRDRLVGCLHVSTDPPDAKLVVVMGDSVIYTASSPALLCELVTKNYEILVTKDGYDQVFQPLQLSAGKVDSVAVTLTTSATAHKKGKRIFPWLARGGIVAVAGAVIYTTVLQSKENGSDALPTPPSRPAR